MSITWFRCYHEMISDRKFKLISVDLNLPRLYLVGVWVSLLSLASESPDRGKLLSAQGKPLPIPFICAEIDLDEAEFTKILDALIAYKMIHHEGPVYAITNWTARQFKSDDAYGRVKEYRKRLSRNVSETFHETRQSTDIYSTTAASSTPDKLTNFYLTYVNPKGRSDQGAADIINDILGAYPHPDIDYALTEAIKAGADSLNYIEAICKRRLAGQPDRPQEVKRGHREKAKDTKIGSKISADARALIAGITGGGG